jgi:hypothetical protein
MEAYPPTSVDPVRSQCASEGGAELGPVAGWATPSEPDQPVRINHLVRLPRWLAEHIAFAMKMQMKKFVVAALCISVSPVRMISTRPF